MSLFLTKQIGVDVADNTIEAVLSGGTKLSSAKIKPGIVKNGRIKNAKELNKVLHDVLSKMFVDRNFVKKIVFGIPDNQVFYHIFKTEKVIKNREIDKVIFEEVVKHIPLPAENLSYKYRFLSQNKDTATYLIVAVDKEALIEWEKFFTESGFDVEFDLSSQALFRVFKIPSVCLVDLGKELTKISLFFENKLFYSYVTFIGGDYLSEKLAEGLKISLVEAEQEKIKNGLSGDDEKANKILTKEFSLISGEIEEALSYAKEELSFEIKQVIFAGGGSKLKGLAEFYAGNKNFNVLLKSSKINKRLISQEYIEAYGLSLKNSHNDQKDFIFNTHDLKINKKVNLIDNTMREKNEKASLSEMSYGRKHGPNFFKHVILLSVILLVGVIGLKYAIIFRNSQRELRIRENVKYVVQYSVVQQAEFKIPIIFSEKYRADVSLPARLIETEVAEGEEYDVARNRGLKEALWLVNKDEYLWEKPISETLSEESLLPEKIQWVAFNKNVARSLFIKEIDKINKNDIDFVLNNLVYKDIIRDERQGVYFLDAELSISSNHIIDELVISQGIDYLVY